MFTALKCIATVLSVSNSVINGY